MGVCNSKRGAEEPGALDAPVGGALMAGKFGAPCEAAEKIFKDHDKNGNGQLDTKELGKLLMAAFPDGNMSDADVTSVMEHLDLDHDGTVGINELRAFLRCYDPATKHIKTKTALIIIDVQNDFITGTLANPFKAQEIVPVINGLRDKFDLVVMSYDAHPQEHCSFAETCNAGGTPIKEELKQFDVFSTVTLVGDDMRPEHTQALYPRHAVRDSEGFQCPKDLVVKDSDPAIYKGTLKNIDSYSAFFDNMKANDTGMTAILQEQGVTDVYCVGLVFDICVKSSALHSAEMGFRTFVIPDACRPFFADNVEPTNAELTKAGVTLMTVAEAEAALTVPNKERTLKEFLADIKKSKGAGQVHKEVQESSTAMSHAPSLQG